MENLINEDILVMQLNSFIPDVTPNGPVANGMSENRAIKNGIKNNNLNTNRDLRNLMSLTSRILDTENTVLQTFLCDKLTYLGFESKSTAVTDDMTVKQKNECFAGSYLLYCQGLMDVQHLLDIMAKLN